MRATLAFALLTSSALAESPLQLQIRMIAADANGQVSVACSLPGSSMTCDLNPRAHAPMQSVFKLPLALAVLQQVERGAFGLNQPIRFLPSDLLPHTYSPLQDKYPEANVDIPLRELLRLAVALSDNVAADILLRLIGGPTVVTNYVAKLGISGFHLQDGEHALQAEVRAQYRNWFEPAAAVQLLRRLSDNSPLSQAHTKLVFEWMENSPRGGKRLPGALPPGTIVAHKAGTSGTDNGIAHATNDIGLITLPDGRRLAIAVFVTHASASEAVRESVIARIAKAAYGEAIKQQP